MNLDGNLLAHITGRCMIYLYTIIFDAVPTHCKCGLSIMHTIHWNEHCWVCISTVHLFHVLLGSPCKFISGFVLRHFIWLSQLSYYILSIFNCNILVNPRQHCRIVNARTRKNQLWTSTSLGRIGQRRIVIYHDESHQ